MISTVLQRSLLGLALGLTGASVVGAQEPPPGIAVLGSVVDGSGRALGGASVQVHSKRADGSVWSSQPLVVGERFELEGIPEGTLVLEARLDGYRVGTCELGPIEKDYVLFDRRIVLIGAQRLAGRTGTPAGSALGDARVWASDGRIRTQVQSDAQGRFTLEGLGPPPWHLWSEHGAGRELRVVRQEFGAAPEGPVELLLQPPGELELDDARAQLLDGFPFLPEASPRGEPSPAWPRHAETATGSLWLGVPSGSVWVKTLDRERGLGAFERVTVNPGLRTTHVPQLAPLTRVRVRTFLELDGQRQPACAQLSVRAASGWVEHEPSLASCFPPEPEAELWLPAGTFTLQAEHAHGRAELALSLERGEAQRDLELVLRR